MIHVHCHTNLDLSNEMWPTEFPAVPNVGDDVQSLIEHENGFKLTLRVVSVTWKTRAGNENAWPYVELHDPRQRSIGDFYEWYAPLVGKSVSSFI